MQVVWGLLRMFPFLKVLLFFYQVQKSRRGGKQKASPSSSGEAGSVAKKIKVDQKEERDEDGTSSDQSVMLLC